MDGRLIGAVAAGGALGATARWGVGHVWSPDSATAFPWHTFAINVVGCLLIGIAAGRIERSSLTWGFIGTGVLGGFTTMSTFAVELNDRADAGANTTVTAYLGATLLAGFGALAIADWTSPRHLDETGPEDVE